MDVRNSLEKIAMSLYSPVAFFQAVTVGSVVSLVHSRPIRYLHKTEETNGFSRDSAFERFKEGFELTFRAYGYIK